MQLTSDRLSALVEADDPVPVVWETLWDIWAPAATDLTEHYDRERTSVSFERTLWDIYREFYQSVLPDRCVTEPDLTVPDDGAVVVMDAMSVREAPLFVAALERAGYDPTVEYGFATVPSETLPYRERVGYTDLKRRRKTTSVSSHEAPDIDGDEAVVWSRYPDSLLETIQEGKTELSSIETAYEKSENVLLSVLEQLDAEQVVITSDHGYVRLEAGYTFPIGEAHKNRLQDVFSDRYVSVGEANADDLIADGLVAEADGHYMPVGRFTWPARGKYSTYQHGGLSLVECLVPRIDVRA